MGDRRKPIPDQIQRRLTKIFVSKIPEGCSGSDLASHVRVFGQIFDLYIARKRDKGGNRFGFISMLDIKDKEELIKNLRGIRIGDSKLWFNVARFVLEEGEINMRNDQKSAKGFNKPTSSGSMGHPGYSAYSGERPFKDLFEGKSMLIDNNVNAFGNLHGRAIVARMNDLESLENIYVILNGICPGFGKVQYIGGLDILISFEVNDIVNLVLEATKSMTDKFHSVAIWKGQSLSFERLVWLKVEGIPLHLMTNETINSIGGKFGKVVHKANKSETEMNLSSAFIAILAGDGKRIAEEVVLNWSYRKFRVWVNEDRGEWAPVFNKVVVKENDDGGSDGEDDRSMDNSVDVSKDTPANNSGEEVNMAINENPIFLERNDDSNEVMNEHSSPMIGGRNIEGGNQETFVPAVNFDFDNVLEVNSMGPTSNVVKRKKFKKNEVGRPSSSYTSSNESLKVVKKPKSNKNDLFGLNGLLGINDEDGSESDGPHLDNVTDAAERSIDLNFIPNSIRQDDAENEENHIERWQNKEVEATKSMAEKLGVQLQDQTILIRESIVNEGLQFGNK